VIGIVKIHAQLLSNQAAYGGFTRTHQAYKENVFQIRHLSLSHEKCLRSNLSAFYDNLRTLSDFLVQRQPA
jgi:hypothetical protein